MRISEQAKELRDCVNRWRSFENVSSSEPFKLLSEAADTIETLSTKLATVNMERSDRHYGGGWISCEDSKNIPDNEQLVWITIEYKGGDIERIEGIFIDGELCYMNGISVSTIAKAWMPRYVPEPYRP